MDLSSSIAKNEQWFQAKTLHKWVQSSASVVLEAGLFGLWGRPIMNTKLSCDACVKDRDMAEENFQNMKVTVGGLRGSVGVAASVVTKPPKAPTPKKEPGVSVLKKPAANKGTNRKGIAGLIMTMVEKEKTLQALMSKVLLGICPNKATLLHPIYSSTNKCFS